MLRLGGALALSIVLHLLLLSWQRTPATQVAGKAGQASLAARLRQEVATSAAPPTATPQSGPDAIALPEPPERSYPAGPAEPEPVDAGSATALPTRSAAMWNYHRELSLTLARFRRTTEQLAGGSQGGRALIRLVVATGGRPQSLELLMGSGDAALDRAAIEMMRLAASHTPVPEELQGSDFNIDLALDFTPPAPVIPATPATPVTPAVPEPAR